MYGLDLENNVYSSTDAIKQSTLYNMRTDIHTGIRHQVPAAPTSEPLVYDIHENYFSHIIKFFSYDLTTFELANIYTHEDVNDPIMIIDMFADDSGIYFIKICEYYFQEKYVMKLNENDNTCTALYQSRDVLRFDPSADKPTWGAINNTQVIISTYENGGVSSGSSGSSYSFRNTQMPFTENSVTYNISKNQSDTLDIDITSHEKSIRINTDYSFMQLIYANFDYVYWIDYPDENDYSYLEIMRFDIQSEQIERVSSKAPGIVFYPAVVNEKLFYYLFHDRLWVGHSDYSPGNIYHLDFDQRAAYNLTNDTLATDIAVEKNSFESPRYRDDTMYFFSEYVNESGERSYLDFYWCDIIK